MAEDYLLRQIRNFGEFISTLLGKERAKELVVTDTIHAGEDVELILYKRLFLGLFQDKKLDKAENLLFSLLEDEAFVEPEPLVEWFYTTLENLDPSFLESAGFNSEEIRQGIEDAGLLLNRQYRQSSNKNYLDKEHIENSTQANT